MQPIVQSLKVILQVIGVIGPRPLIDPSRSALLQREEGVSESVNSNVVHEGGKLLLLIPGNYFSYASARL